MLTYPRIDVVTCYHHVPHAAHVVTKSPPLLAQADTLETKKWDKFYGENSESDKLKSHRSPERTSRMVPFKKTFKAVNEALSIMPRLN